MSDSKSDAGQSGAGTSKIVVDEDWKAQVERERDAAKAAESTTGQSAVPATGETGQPVADNLTGAASAHNEGSSAAARSEESTGRRDRAREKVQIPPANFHTLVETLAMPAMVALSHVQEGPDTERDQSLAQVQHFIQLLQVLEDSLAKGVSGDERQFLETALHQLRWAYLNLPGGK